MKFELEPAYVLHTKPYRETSLLIKFFTENYGIIPAIARSARGMRSRFRGYLVPFSPLLISCAGKSDLLSLNAVEANGAGIFFQGKTLFNSLYLNEVLCRLLQSFDAYPKLFASYKNTLMQLQQNENTQQAVLRSFEMKLLKELGYGLNLDIGDQESEIKSDRLYYYNPEQGFKLCTTNTPKEQIFKGSDLLAIKESDFSNPDILVAARRLMRLAIGFLLGDYKIKSRELFT